MVSTSSATAGFLEILSIRGGIAPQRRPLHLAAGRWLRAAAAGFGANSIGICDRTSQKTPIGKKNDGHQTINQSKQLSEYPLPGGGAAAIDRLRIFAL